MSVKLTEWEIEYLISKVEEGLRLSKVDGRDQATIKALDSLYHKIQ